MKLVIRTCAMALSIFQAVAVFPPTTAAAVQMSACSKRYLHDVRYAYAGTNPGGWRVKAALVELLYARKDFEKGAPSLRLNSDYRTAVHSIGASVPLIATIIGGGAGAILRLPICSDDNSATGVSMGYLHLLNADIALQNADSVSGRFRAALADAQARIRAGGDAAARLAARSEARYRQTPRP